MSVHDTQQDLDAIKETVFHAMEEVIDPELGIDIVNLGLVYEIRVEPGGHVDIDISLTTMGCPLADLITDQIYHVLKTIPEVTSSEVKLVWYPAWTPQRMSRYARIALGITL